MAIAAFSNPAVLPNTKLLKREQSRQNGNAACLKQVGVHAPSPCLGSWLSVWQMWCRWISHACRALGGLSGVARELQAWGVTI